MTAGGHDFYALSDSLQADRLTLLAQAAADHWEGGFTIVELVKYRENAVFSARLTNGQRVAVRVHRHGYHSDAAVHSELHWMHEIGCSGAVEVPNVVPAANGELVVHVSHPAVPESRRVSVLGWLPGIPVGSSENGADVGDDVAVKLYFDAGVLAAKLHNHASTMTMPIGFTRHAWDEAGLVGPDPLWGRFWDHPQLTRPARDLLARARSASLIDLASFGKSSHNYGLIHADFVPENLLNDNGALKLIDFDDAGFGWHMYELATALYFNAGESRYPRIVRSLIEGYRTVRSLPEEHEALLPLFLFLRATTYVGWVQSRPETETAKTLGPMLVERACMAADDYLTRRADR
ncbi:MULTISPECIES: phosphotransferase [unclassified Mycolicibacterium]|uniref:phosphotransferase enzyme family protein n=1 Tax=unclassified Mycolicibacterium TaxID=2636767 RepID=UPI00130C3441|nr:MULTISPECIES: phosphotransferase [unclassified Mycolicibacterium]MUL82971.1 phosphotransferase [Mycolicibacterium sp. CBMA 329]MUL89306.1 phosphotransferase [Mycolicibacterium sp. CBMA 331]MUM02773.1 phosphotransferase [Mycolicibacterium sp. CBMA 334]MUM28905.1 phosphotransferase [Mycolicibacterium sp. CBMA 295]MUM38822.1 phosphotransferase [Mycolicibacterium sp. CBMA 247]